MCRAIIHSACATFAAGAIVMKHNFGSLEGLVLARRGPHQWSLGAFEEGGCEEQSCNIFKEMQMTIYRWAIDAIPHSFRLFILCGLRLQCFFQTTHWAGWCPVIPPQCVDNILTFRGRNGCSTRRETIFFKLQFPSVLLLYLRMYGKLHHTVYTSHCNEINCVGTGKDATIKQRCAIFKKSSNLKKYINIITCFGGNFLYY